MTAIGRLTGFAALLGAVFAVAAFAGARADLGASPPRSPATHQAMRSSDGHGASEQGARPDAVRGLAVSQRGLTLELPRTSLRAGTTARLAFRIADAAGRTVRGFDVAHAKRMHVILVRRDLTGFQHLHPVQGADGSWSVRVRVPEGGTYRLFADFSRHGAARTLGADLAVSGPGAARALPAPTTATSVDGLTVAQRAPASRAGRETELDYAVTRGGRPVPLQPYLGARGHLVALREGDLAFLHVHPEADRLRFATRFPSSGRYRLFVQFKSAGRVHTAAFTREVGR